MSGKLIGQIYGLILKPAKRDLLIALADHAKDDGSNSHPGTDFLAWKLDISVRQVLRLLKELEQDGLIIATTRPAPNKPIVYQIDLSKGDKKSPFDRRQNVMRSHDKKSPVQVNQRMTSHEKDATSTHDTPSANLLRNLTKDQPLKEKESTPVPFSEAQSFQNKNGSEAHDDIDNDMVAMMQADVFMRTYEKVCKERGAPQTLARTRHNKRAGGRYYRDGYSEDEIRRVVEKSFTEGKPVAFAFLGERLMQQRAAKTTPFEGVTFNPNLKPVEWGVNHFVNKPTAAQHG